MIIFNQNRAIDPPPADDGTELPQVRDGDLVAEIFFDPGENPGFLFLTLKCQEA
jgi:hypothetical protein